MLKKEERLHFFKNMKKTWRYMKNYKFTFIIYIVFHLLLAVVGIIFPIYSSQMIVQVTNGEMEQFLYSTILILIISLSEALILYFKSFAFQRIHKNILINMQLEIAEETLKLEVEEVDKNTTGLFVNRLTRDTSKFATFFDDYTDTLSHIISSLGVVITMFIVSKEISAFLLVTALIIFYINKKGVKNRIKIRKEYEKLDDQKTTLMVESVRGIRDIKVLNSLEYVKEKLNEKIFDSVSKFNEFNRNRSKNNLIQSLVRITSNVVVALLIIALYNNKLITIPAIILIFNYRWRIYGLMIQINSLLEYNANFVLTSDKIFEVIEDEKFSKEQFGDLEVKKLEGNIKFENVGFAYTEGKEILKNVSFEIKANEKIAFVGKSGAGKTTIFNLITKLYNRTSGNILLDNYDIDKLDRNSLRDNMSIITQNPYIFNFSIKDNLLLAKPDASIEEIQEACKLACIDEYISGLEKGYDTIVGENGIILSGGQKQRLAIARALLMKTEIILLDEATSALDNETQSEIQKAIENLKGEYTILIIAHRLSTVIDSDRIFVVDNGQIVDTGTHEELLKNSEYYKGLYKKELKV